MVLTTLVGTEGLAIVDTFVGENASRLPSKSTLARFSGPGLAEANNMLTKAALKQVRRKLRRAWIGGKLLLLGLGAVAGTAANRKLADEVIKRVGQSLDPVPDAFTTPLPPKKDDGQDSQGLSVDPKRFAQWILNIFGRGKNDAEERAQVDAAIEATK